MRFTTLIKNPADWMKGSGPHSEVVMTSRVRLARNLRGFPFPGYSPERERVELMEMARPSVESLPVMKDFLASAPDAAPRVRLRLAQILILQEERPSRALEVLSEIPAGTLPGELEKTRSQLERHARKLIADGAIEIDDA